MKQDLIVEGQVIGVKPERLKEYLYLHRHIPANIRQAIRDAGFVKLEIFVRQLPDGKPYLFKYSERLPGSSDAPLETEAYREWLDVTGECQQPLPGETFWKTMDYAFALQGEPEN